MFNFNEFLEIKFNLKLKTTLLWSVDFKHDDTIFISSNVNTSNSTKYHHRPLLITHTPAQ
jgi:hypothetical protein